MKKYFIIASLLLSTISFSQEIDYKSMGEMLLKKEKKETGYKFIKEPKNKYQLIFTLKVDAEGENKDKCQTTKIQKYLVTDMETLDPLPLIKFKINDGSVLIVPFSRNDYTLVELK